MNRKMKPFLKMMSTMSAKMDGAIAKISTRDTSTSLTKLLAKQLEVQAAQQKLQRQESMAMMQMLGSIAKNMTRRFFICFFFLWRDLTFYHCAACRYSDNSGGSQSK